MNNLLLAIYINNLSEYENIKNHCFYNECHIIFISPLKKPIITNLYWSWYEIDPYKNCNLIYKEVFLIALNNNYNGCIILNNKFRISNQIYQNFSNKISIGYDIVLLKNELKKFNNWSNLLHFYSRTYNWKAPIICLSKYLLNLIVSNYNLNFNYYSIIYFYKQKKIKIATLDYNLENDLGVFNSTLINNISKKKFYRYLFLSKKLLFY